MRSHAHLSMQLPSLCNSQREPGMHLCRSLCVYVCFHLEVCVSGPVTAQDENCCIHDRPSLYRWSHLLRTSIPACVWASVCPRERVIHPGMKVFILNGRITSYQSLSLMHCGTHTHCACNTHSSP